MKMFIFAEMRFAYTTICSVSYVALKVTTISRKSPTFKLKKKMICRTPLAQHSRLLGWFVLELGIHPLVHCSALRMLGRFICAVETSSFSRAMSDEYWNQN